jgi:hypothetical protein
MARPFFVLSGQLQTAGSFPVKIFSIRLGHPTPLCYHAARFRAHPGAALVRAVSARLFV